MFAGAAMVVPEQVDAGRDGAVERDAAGRRHPGRRDRRGPHPVIDPSDQRGLEQLRLAGRQPEVANEKADHAGVRGRLDQPLDRLAAEHDVSGSHITDGGLPPGVVAVAVLA